MFVQPVCASLAISLTLFCIVMDDWYAGIGYIIFTYTQMFILCALGQSVQTNVSYHAIIHQSHGNVCIARESIFHNNNNNNIKTFQNERLANIIYGSSWYRFPIAEQKDMCRALLRAQSSKELWMGPFAPLNLETSSKVNALTDN